VLPEDVFTTGEPPEELLREASSDLFPVLEAYENGTRQRGHWSTTRSWGFLV
jgi:hypothetical protein